MCVNVLDLLLLPLLYAVLLLIRVCLCTSDNRAVSCGDCCCSHYICCHSLKPRSAGCCCCKELLYPTAVQQYCCKGPLYTAVEQRAALSNNCCVVYSSTSTSTIPPLFFLSRGSAVQEYSNALSEQYSSGSCCSRVLENQPDCCTIPWAFVFNSAAVQHCHTHRPRLLLLCPARKEPELPLF